MNTLDPLQSLLLDGRGGAQEIPPEEVAERAAVEVHWLHLDYKDPASVEWLRERSGTDEVLVEALLADDPRPRSLVQGDALMVILRGANLNPGADPEDMVSLRLWLEARRVITFRHRRLVSVQEVVDQLAAGNGPVSTGDLLYEIVAAIFLPLGLLTGLLGINVGGIPGTQSSIAFTVVTLSLVVLAVLQWWWFKRRSMV